MLTHFQEFHFQISRDFIDHTDQKQGEMEKSDSGSCLLLVLIFLNTFYSQYTHFSILTAVSKFALN